MGLPFKVDQTLDCKGLKCPVPVIKTKKALDGMMLSQILEMVATDPGSKPDMIAFSKRTGHELLDMKEENGLFIFYFRKTK